MNSDTGAVRSMILEDARPKLMAREVEVNEQDMTTKQKRNRSVSIHDMRSKLGVRRQAEIRKVGRNNPCPCGSGKKYKKCCLR